MRPKFAKAALYSYWAEKRRSLAPCVILRDPPSNKSFLGLYKIQEAHRFSDMRVRLSGLRWGYPSRTLTAVRVNSTFEVFLIHEKAVFSKGNGLQGKTKGWHFPCPFPGMTLSLSRNRKNEGTCQKKHGMIKSLRCRWEVLSPTAINNRQAPVAQMDRAALWCGAVSETSTWNHWEKPFRFINSQPMVTACKE